MFRHEELNGDQQFSRIFQLIDVRKEKGSTRHLYKIDFHVSGVSNTIIENTYSFT